MTQAHCDYWGDGEEEVCSEDWVVEAVDEQVVFAEERGGDGGVRGYGDGEMGRWDWMVVDI